MNSYKVLVVDDDEFTLTVLERILSEAQYEVFKARNGKECIQRAKEIVPDIIVLDIMMPELDGIAVVLKLKAIKETASIPIIISTAVKESEDEIVARNLGVADYINKTSQMEGLISKIEKILNK